MKKYQWMLMGLTLVFEQVNANPLNLDVYGVDQPLQNKILACCQKEFSELVDLADKASAAYVNGGEWKPFALKKRGVEKSILKKINRYGQFNKAQISTIFYDNQIPYTTVDIVKANETNRLPASPKREIKHIVKDKGLTELYKSYSQYDKHAIALMQKGDLSEKGRSCPFIHCTWHGFSKEELISIAPKLAEGAVKYKQQLMNIVEHSDNNVDRQKAIFILGSTTEYKDFVPYLMKFIADEDQGVRNNVMRVLASITAHHELAGVDIHQVLKAIDYPFVTDRNKASAILYNIVQKNKASHPLIINTSGDNLVKLLKLKQPNNHDYAYRILRIVSNQNYSETDYSAWQKWVDAQKNKSITG